MECLVLAATKKAMLCDAKSLALALASTQSAVHMPPTGRLASLIEVENKRKQRGFGAANESERTIGGQRASAARPPARSTAAFFVDSAHLRPWRQFKNANAMAALARRRDRRALAYGQQAAPLVSACASSCERSPLRYFFFLREQRAFDCRKYFCVQRLKRCRPTS